MTYTNSPLDAPYAALLIAAMSMRPNVPKNSGLPSRDLPKYVVNHAISLNNGQGIATDER